MWGIGSPRTSLRARHVVVVGVVSALLAATAAAASVATDGSSGTQPAPNGWSFNGAARPVTGGVQLTSDGHVAEAGSLFQTTPVNLSVPTIIDFDATMSGGTGGADGVALVFADATRGATPNRVGVSGSGLGFAGIPGVAVTLDTFQNVGDPGNNFVGIANGADPDGTPHYIATATNIPDLRSGTHHLEVDAFPGHLNVIVDGHWVRSTDVPLPALAYVGFTAGNGAFTDNHVITNIEADGSTGTGAATPTPTTPTTATPTTTPPLPLPPAPETACVGTRMTAGQADIDAAPPGTTFCLSGTHNWTLSPKSGDQLIGPAALDGAHSTQFAIEAGTASNVQLADLEITNYTAANQQGAIHVPDRATGWILRDLQVHDNGTSAGGAGASLGYGWQVLGGRYYNNRQEGFGGTGGNDVLSGVEIDHNNFTDDTYTRANVDCGFEAGGFKWASDNVTVENSEIHDNACKGLWVDVFAQGATIVNNVVYNNWDEGIFIEISSGATVTGNDVYNNGWHTNGTGCAWLWGGGITLSSSDHTEIAGNTVTGNCNGITATQQNRPGTLQNDSIHDNTIAGPGGKTGAAADNGADLATRDIVFANNTLLNGMTACGLTC
jgi:parallel beta-helix repeat protein